MKVLGDAADARLGRTAENNREPRLSGLVLRAAASSLSWWVYLLALAAIAFLVVLGISKTQNGAFRDHLDIYSQFMVSPVILVFPLLVTVLVCTRFYSEIGNRFITNVRSRVDVRRYVAARLIASTAVALTFSFLLAFVPFIVAFYVWPIVGDPGIDPSVYLMSQAEALADSFGRTSFSFLLAGGPLLYGCIYSLWVGIIGGALSALALAAVLVVSNKALAFVAPFLLYIVATLLASLLGVPQAGLMFSVFPFGLTAQPALVAAAAGIGLIVIVIGAWILLFRRLRTLDRMV